MHDTVECEYCSGGTQWRDPVKGWGKIPKHMLHKVREEGGDIIFNADALVTDYRNCKQCNGRGVSWKLRESEVDG
jgi:hypothetical protein